MNVEIESVMRTREVFGLGMGVTMTAAEQCVAVVMCKRLKKGCVVMIRRQPGSIVQVESVQRKDPV